MTDNKGRLSLGSDVNLKKVLKNAQLKKKSLQDSNKKVQIEVRCGRSKPNVIDDISENKDSKDERLQDLINALRKEEKIVSLEEKSEPVDLGIFDESSESSEKDGFVDEIKFSSEKVTDDDYEEEFKEKKSSKGAKKGSLDKVKNKKDIMNLLEEDVDIQINSEDESNILEINTVNLAKPKITIKSRYSDRFVKKDKVVKKVKIYEFISVAKLAHEMGEQFIKVSKKLKEMGINNNKKTDELDLTTAELIVEEFGHISLIEKKSDIKDILSDRSKDLISRSPIVTIMGHVDHGKTTLLGALKNMDLTTGEAGGITQHIGAYQVDFNGQKITFIDTPGHEAFSQIRARGAKITDIVILVVAANDSVKPQTIEAINHAQASNVPIVVAINKCDLEDSDPIRVKQDLLQHNIIVEEMGGDVISVEISAQKRKNLDKLMEAVLLQAEIMDLKANEKDLASGVVIEVKVAVGQGIVGTIIVQNGTLKVGDAFIIGDQIGKVRSIIDSNGKKIKFAIPSQPVQIIGIKSMPNVGDKVVAFQSESEAQKVLNDLKSNVRSNVSNSDNIDIDSLFSENSNQVKKINLIVKADTYGSIEGIMFALGKISNDSFLFNFVSTGIGIINESDVMLAQATDSLVISFNVDIQNRAKDEAYKYNIKINKYKIIYQLVDDLTNLSEGMNENNILNTSTGKCKVLKVFDFKKHKVAGCLLEEGEGKISDCICVVRDNNIVHKGNIKSLRFVKENIPKVSEGEFGLISRDFNSYKEDDIIYFVPKV